MTAWKTPLFLILATSFSSCAHKPQETGLFTLYAEQADLFATNIKEGQSDTSITNQAQQLIKIVRAGATTFLDSNPSCQAPVTDLMRKLKSLEAMTESEASAQFHAIKNWNPKMSEKCADLTKLLLNPWRVIVLTLEPNSKSRSEKMENMVREASVLARKTQLHASNSTDALSH